MSRFRPSLQLVILGPALGLILVGGIVLYLLVLRTISSYADQNIRNSLDALLRGAATIADSEVDRQNREGDMNSLFYQLNTRIRLEDFAREQNVGIIVIADGLVDFATGISEDEARVIAGRPDHGAGPGLYAATTHFSPWNWDLVVTRDAIDFQALVGQVRAVYLGSTLALLAVGALVFFGLRQFLVQPIFGIAGEFAMGKSPTYRGIAELEHLSKSIGDMLATLQARQQEQEMILKSMSDAIAVYDGETRLTAWNPQYEQLNRYPPGLLKRGMHLADVIRYNIDRGDYGVVDAEERIAKALRRARSLDPPRFEVERADGTSLEVRRAPMPDGGFVTTYTDITPQKQSARLEASNEAKSRFLENMSHDLRKPIAAVIEDARVLAADGMDLPKASRAVLQSIEGNATHLLGMVDELLEMARIEAGQIRVKPEPVPLASLVDGARRVVERQATAKGLSVETEVDRRLTLVSDPRLLTRVVVNLLSNAVEYTARGSVSVCAAQGDGKIALRVTDTGPGISRADQELIFGKFQRLQSTAGMTKPGVGLGLGLPISREFARLLGGDLTLQSEVGRGSTFILTLPLEYQQTS